jgi:hypothetical protein
MSRCTEALVVALLVAAAPSAAYAHDTATSTFETRPAVSAAGPGLQVVLRLDATSVLDITGVTGGDPVLGYLDRRFTVTRDDGTACPREAPRWFTHDPAAKAIVIDVVYRCGGRVTIESTLFHDELIPHTVIGTVHGGGRADRHFFTRGERSITVDVQAPARGGFRTATPPDGAFRTQAPAPAAPSADSDDESLLSIAISIAAVLVAGFCFRRLIKT